jgi:tetratricopeptide (TPR) repeat protein
MSTAGLYLVLAGLSGVPLGVTSEPDLAAVAAASSRPKECQISSRTGKPTFWRKVRFPQQERYCNLVARAHIELLEDAGRALAFAEEAQALWPGRPGATLAKARALLLLGKPAEALELLEAVERVVPASFDEPRALWSLARSLALGGKLDRAETAYRKLVPRISLMRLEERVQVLVEAAFLLSAVDEQAKEGKSTETGRIQDALSFLTEAQRAREGLPDVLIATALFRLRTGAGPTADIAWDEAVASVGAKASSSRALSDADRLVSEAISLAAKDSASAAARLESAAKATSSVPFGEALRAKAKALGRLGSGSLAKVKVR